VPAGLTDEQLAAARAAALTDRFVAAESTDVDSDEFPTPEVAPEPVAAADGSAPLEISPPAPVEAIPTIRPHSKDVHEVDLSDEWLSVLRKWNLTPRAENAEAHAKAHRAGRPASPRNLKSKPSW
jgi:hypothetical protein